MITPEAMVAAIQRRFGVHAGYAALHAKGAIYRGTFTPTEEAAALTTAAHFHDHVDVTARLSNGGGNPKIPDYAPDVRGLAVKFHLPDGTTTDILAQTTPKSPIATPEAFHALMKASKPGPAALIHLPAAVLRAPKLLTSARVNTPTLAPPTSFAGRAYWAFHAFRWKAPDGSARWVRYTFQPEQPAPNLSSGAARAKGRDYLFEDMTNRLSQRPVRWSLEVQVAGEGDDPHDTTDWWPDSREVVTVGTLELIESHEPDGPVIFDPMN
ncbi:MAG: catalase, partial [Nitriliruptorales bacterium]|nr:catalase [Nitriliruptorales bacterium]